MIHLIASSNFAYANRITAWLDAADAYGAGLRVTLACVEPGDWSAALAADYPRLHILGVERAALAFPPPLDHLQAGGFLAALGAAPDDTIVFTDGDAYLQRPLADEEVAALEGWSYGTLGLSYNAGPGDCLASEAARLRPIGDAYLSAGFDLGLPLYNLGVIVARARDYARWHEAYREIRPRVEPLFRHHAAQQWGLCAAIPAAGLSVTVLPYSFHLHGHYPAPDGTGRDRGRVTWRGHTVAFRHYI